MLIDCASTLLAKAHLAAVPTRRETIFFFYETFNSR